MVMDHSRGFLGPEYKIAMTMFGRMALPLFIYLIYAGYKRTRNIKRYYLRLFLLAIISEPFYFLWVGRYCNIIWVLIYVLLLYEIAFGYKKVWLAVLVNCGFYFLPGYWFFAGFIALSWALPLGVMQFIAILVVNLVWSLSPGMPVYQGMAALSVPLVYLAQGLSVPRVPDWFRWSFYPAHMLILAIIPEIIVLTT